MMVHHVATIVLLYFSWILNFVRVGSLVLVVHDAADTWLSVRILYLSSTKRVKWSMILLTILYVHVQIEILW